MDISLKLDKQRRLPLESQVEAKVEVAEVVAAEVVAAEVVAEVRNKRPVLVLVLVLAPLMQAEVAEVAEGVEVAEVVAAEVVAEVRNKRPVLVLVLVLVLAPLMQP